MDRIQILDDLRAGVIDVLIGVNLLREGLDLPEVSLVAIIDADKEGFLRSHRSLTQTVGRAARNLNGTVIMYADKITDSMRLTLEETERRRSIQLAYNEEHHITPQAIVKPRTAIIGQEPTMTDNNAHAKKRERRQTKADAKAAFSYQSVEPSETTTDIAADPVVGYMSADELQRSIEKTRSEMLKAAKDMDFMTAAQLRDEMLKMEDLLKKKTE